MRNKIFNMFLIFMIFSMAFNNIPKFLQMNFLGGAMGSKLVFYPIIIGIIYTAYCQLKYQDVLVDFNIYKRFMAAYVGVNCISLIIGLYNFPYYEMINSGPINQIDKLPTVLDFFKRYGIDISNKIIICLWMVARFLKGFFLEVLYTFGGAYMIYCWYKDNWKTALKNTIKGVLCALIIIFSYSVVELMYLSGCETAKGILECINPFVHTLGENGFWWPPLLWPGQLRSLFVEPSYFGIYCAFALPFIWLMVLKVKLNKKYFYMYVCADFVMSFFLILTKARTGFMLHVGELVILFILLIYTQNKMLLKKGLIVLLCSMFAFVCGNLFIAKFIDVNKVADTKLTTIINNYVYSNAKSLANPDARSNRARYSVMEADIKVGLDHPLIGVGSGLRNAYVINAFSEKALSNHEVKMWMDFNKRLGILKFGIPKLGEYTSRFAETGILGLLVFLLPAIYLIVNMLSKLKRIPENIQIAYIIFLTSFVGILASGIGDSINITYCYWVLLGLGYTMCFGRQEEKVDNE